VWFLVLAVGAFLVHRAHAPAPVAALLTNPPPAEVKLALYFLLAALVRLLILDARVAAHRRRQRRDARRVRKDERPALLDVGAGVGKGVAEVLVGADILGAAIATIGAFLRLLWRSTRLDPSEVARRAREREQKIARERRRAAFCLTSVGLVCAALAWSPWLETSLPAGMARAAEAIPGIKAAVARVTRPAPVPQLAGPAPAPQMAGPAPR
jgi:hypothetical protein